MLCNQWHQIKIFLPQQDQPEREKLWKRCWINDQWKNKDTKMIESCFSIRSIRTDTPWLWKAFHTSHYVLKGGNTDSGIKARLNIVKWKAQSKKTVMRTMQMSSLMSTSKEWKRHSTGEWTEGIRWGGSHKVSRWNSRV